MKKQIILTGHDLGYAQSINDGFAYALSSLPKAFSELSIIPNSDYSLPAAAIAKSSGISTNLCFCLTNSKFTTLSSSASLVDSSNHLKNSDTKNWDFSVIDSFLEEDIARELHAQYQWYIVNFGHKPSALVSQKGEHGDPKILIPMMEIAKREGLPIRAPLWSWKANYGAQSLVESEGIKTTDHVLMALKDWRGEFGYDLETELDQIITLLHNQSGVTEIFLFAGFCDQDLFDMTSISWQRGQILNILKRKYHIIEKLYSEFDVISYQDL